VYFNCITASIIQLDINIFSLLNIAWRWLQKAEIFGRFTSSFYIIVSNYSAIVQLLVHVWRHKWFVARYKWKYVYVKSLRYTSQIRSVCRHSGTYTAMEPLCHPPPVQINSVVEYKSPLPLKRQKISNSKFSAHCTNRTLLWQIFESIDKYSIILSMHTHVPCMYSDELSTNQRISRYLSLMLTR
jgi:hypothetical protein